MADRKHDLSSVAAALVVPGREEHILGEARIHSGRQTEIPGPHRRHSFQRDNYEERLKLRDRNTSSTFPFFFFPSAPGGDEGTIEARRGSPVPSLFNYGNFRLSSAVTIR